MSKTEQEERDEVNRLIRVAAHAADEKLGIDVVVLDVADLLVITDAFIIVSAKNDRQVRAIVDEVERQLKLADGDAPRRVEGLDEGRWVLMDFGDFVVHVFDEETREYYDLEHLWSNAERMDWQAAS